MRLTKTIKNQIIDAIMADVSKIGYDATPVKPCKPEPKQ